MRILNLTQHDATPDQVSAGVVEPEEAKKTVVRGILTFDEIPSDVLLRTRAETLAMYASGAGFQSVMIGGAPFFMGPLERALKKWGITPLYAFSRRETVEVRQSDGSVHKTQVFRHEGFVEAASQ